MKRIVIYLGLATVLVASCSIQEEDYATPQQDDVIYFASFEQPTEAGTKVYANEDLLLRWTADDRVSIFGKNTYNQQYEFLGETGDNSGGFGKVDGAEYVTGNPIPHTVSVYPYRESTKISEDEVISVSLPAEQRYAKNTFGLGTNTMVSVSSDNVLQFKNVGGYLVLQLYGQGVAVESITLKGNNGETLAGKASVIMPLDGTPSLTMASDANTEISLTCDVPVVLGETQEESIQFWFTIPPIEFEDGFTITVKDYSGSIFEKSTTKSIAVERNKLSRMAPIEVVVFPEVFNQIEIEREALISIYRALDGDNWNNNTNWCSDKPVSEWYGIRTFNGLVTEILLPCNNMNGTISSDMLKFRELRELYVESNPLRIELTDNKPLWFNRLWRFNVRYCEPYSSLPEWFYVLPAITRLEMSIDRIPPEIGRMTGLTHLDLTTTPTQIPSEIGQLTKLRELNIFGSLTGSSSSIEGGALPESIGNLRALEILCIGLMNCSGSIPSTFANLSNLRVLTLSSNNLSGEIPSELGRLTGVMQLDLSYNQLTGPLPESICNLSNLCLFNVGQNDLSGELPADLGRLFDSVGTFWEVDFNIADNHFSGKIPDSILSHPKWKHLWYPFVNFNNFDLQGITIPGPDIKGTDIFGNPVDSDQIYKENKLTILYQYITDYGDKPWYFPCLPYVKNMFDAYKDKSVSIVAWGQESETVEEDIAFVHQYGLEDWIFLNAYKRYVNGHSCYPWIIYPDLILIDDSGNVILDSTRLVEQFSYDEITDFIGQYFESFNL